MLTPLRLARRPLPAIIVGTCLVSMTLGTGTAFAATGGSADTLKVLSGQVYRGIASSIDRGAVAGDRPMSVAVAMSVDSAERDAAYQAMYTKGSPSYHQFLTPQQFNQRFGVSQAAAQRVRAYATRDGLSVTYANPDGSYLLLSGTTAEVDKTFKVVERDYAAANGHAYTATAVGPTVPSEVEAVAGLTSLETFKTADATNDPDNERLCLGESPAPAGTPADLANACIGALSPSDLWSVYDQPSTDRGAGGKIAIFGEGKIEDVVSDLRAFEKGYGLPYVPVRQVLVGDDLSDDSGAIEWDLDSQASTGMAPDVQQLDFYFGSTLIDASIGATYAAWANDPQGPLTGNSSFGGPEQLEYLGGFVLDQLLQQAALEGRTMFNSAGDGGSSCIPGANGITNDGVPCVQYPSSSPYVTSVGGTVLYTKGTSNPGFNAGSEIMPAQRQDEYSWAYSGGGQSDFEPAPAWQVSAEPTGTNQPCALGNSQGQPCRGVPDVSAQSGDDTNGYAFYDGGAISEEGGTSLSSPLWAGMWTRVVAAYPSSCSDDNAVTKPAVAGTPGFAQPLLYAVGNDPTKDSASFFDVGGTTDSFPFGNGTEPDQPRSPVDPTGYDYVSGLGTPILTPLIQNVDCGNTTAVGSTTYPGDPNPADGAPGPGFDVVDNYDSVASVCGTNGQLDDPTNDVAIPSPAGDAYNLTHVSLTSDGTGTTFATTVVDATADAANDIDYAFEFTDAGGEYAVTVDTGPAPAAELYKLTDIATGLGALVQLDPTALATLTPTISGNTISTVLPFAAFNTAATPTTPLGVGSVLSEIAVFSDQGPAQAGLDSAFDGEPLDQADFFECSYVASPTLGADLPEAPAAVLIPLAAIAAGASAVGLRRRRRAAIARYSA